MRSPAAVVAQLREESPELGQKLGLGVTARSSKVHEWVALQPKPAPGGMALYRCALCGAGMLRKGQALGSPLFVVKLSATEWDSQAWGHRRPPCSA